MVANQRLDAVHVIAKDTDRRAKEAEAEAKAQATKEKVALAASRTIEDFKNSEDFKDKVGEAILDDYLKGFAKYKAKVSAAHFGLDLKNIIALAEEQEGEEEEGEGVEISAMKPIAVKA